MMSSTQNLGKGVKRNTFESYRNKTFKKGKEKIAEKITEKSNELGSKLKEGVKKTGEAIKDGAKAYIDSNVSTITNAISVGQNVASGVTKTLFDIAPSSSKSAPIEKEEKEEKKDEKKIEKKEKEKPVQTTLYKKHLRRVNNDEKDLKPINRPAIFFIKGFGMFSSNNDDGLEEMSGAYKNGKVFDWDEKERMIHEISRRPKEQPVILVGHSYGADTAVEIANELNSLDKRFRKVDLLVTMDSVGRNNDIVPENVRHNMNIITESMFFGDEPNIARDSKKTLVTNDLRPEGHTEIDNKASIQSEIINAIDLIINR